MQYVIGGRSPSSVFRFFEEISAIPRASFCEERIADYLVDFAKARGLFYVRDKINNVMIRRPATKGQEGKPALLFQGHTDMVCEKNADTVHDFSKDGLKLYLDGKLLRAKGTTLGADNGIAVAMMLAILDGELPSHPTVECLFTTAEEVGLNGAMGFDYSHLTARRMVNLDSEELGVVTAGCAGGIRSDLILDAQTEPFCGSAICLRIGGLMGGHSGENINSGRANANKLMGRILASLVSAHDARLISLRGGSKDNAIPRECEAVIAVKDAHAAITLANTLGEQIKRELGSDDAGFFLTAEQTEQPSSMLTKEDSANAIAVIACAANGVLEMSRDVNGLVEYSRNLGVITTKENQICFVFSARSSIESRLDASTQELDALARVTGCVTKHYSRYPGWDYAKTSALRDSYLAAYRDVMGKDAVINVIHAGLECGIIRSKVPDMDMISVGPTMFDIHSPDEALDLDATEQFWKTVARLVEIS
ncbi:MAG: aminoacyl-histidine dipeptidase [Clostridia bacterium]|nr:aminoacyl-histidine dipeptidase [Clostridia bacterium]